MNCKRVKFLTVILVIGMFMMFSSSVAFAHIESAKTQFPDLESSPQASDVMFLVGLDVIPQTPVYEPDQKLSLKDLASWAALAGNLGVGGETPNIDQLAQKAENKGLVSSLNGTATYQDINKAIFQGQLSLSTSKAKESPTKAQAAAFVMAHVKDKINGKSLMDRKGAGTGPSGKVTKVTINGKGDDAPTDFEIGGKTYHIYEHAKVMNGPVDLSQWEGLSVNRSVMMNENGQPSITYLETSAANSGNATAATNSSNSANQQTHQKTGVPSWVFYVLIIIIVILAIVIFGARRGKSRK